MRILISKHLSGRLVCFGILKKYAIATLAIFQGYELKIEVSMTIDVVCKKLSNLKVYAAGDRHEALYVIITINNHHNCVRNMWRNK